MPERTTEQQPSKADYIKVLDTLLALRPRQRRLLRDYPETRNKKAAQPARETDLPVLIAAGMLIWKRGTPALTPMGFVAQAEILKAEAYVAGHFVAGD